MPLRCLHFKICQLGSYILSQELISLFRSNRSIEEDEENNAGHGNGHGVRKIKILAIQQVILID